MAKKLLLAFLSVLCISSCTGNIPKNNDPQAVNGFLDLSGWNITDESPLLMRGEWEFYPGKLLYASDFAEGLASIPPDIIKVPGDWNNFLVNGKKFGSTGFATYRLKVKIKNIGATLAIKPGSILSAYRLYINGELVGGRGIVGTTRETSVPQIYSETIKYAVTGENLDMILQISNYHHRQGGPWDKIEIGSYSDTALRERSVRDLDFFIFGALIVMGIFYCSMFFSRKKDSSYLYFALFCLVIALRMTLQSGVGYLNEAFPGLPWEIINKLEYITIYTALPFFLLFILSFFKDIILEYLLKFVLVVSGIFILGTIVTTSLFHSRLIPIYQILLVISGTYILILMFRRCRKDIFARILLVGTFLLFGTVVNDILYSNGVIKTSFIVSYGLLLFIMFQAYVLMVRFIDIYNSVERQKRQLIKTNSEFREEIEKRARIEEDLKAMNEHLVLARSAIILGLAKIAEYRDSDTGSHLARIQEFNRTLALQLIKNPKYGDYISIEYINDLYESSILHDIGKVGVPDSILLKPGKLLPEEFDQIKKHPEIGGDTIRSIEKNINAQTFLTLGREIAYMHHERWDGMGYPKGISGEAIPLSARITSLSDVYDALTTKRCYKDAFTHEKAVEIIKSERGKQFDPDIVDAFLSVQDDFFQLARIMKDTGSSVENIPVI